MSKKLTVEIDDSAVEKKLDDLFSHLNSIPKVKRLHLSLLVQKAVLKLTKQDVEEIWSTHLKGEDLFWFHLHKNGMDESSKGEFLQKLIENFGHSPKKQTEQGVRND